MVGYEDQLDIRWSDQKMEWDYWNAVLFAGTVCTTIGRISISDLFLINGFQTLGYGHIYPQTSAGKILTMIYALGGIPLVLLVLQDLGKLLTVLLKYPWFQFKRAFRRSLRYGLYYPRLRTTTGSKAYCIEHDWVGLNTDQGGSTVVGGNTINSALRRKYCGGNSLTLLRPRWRFAIIVLHLRVFTALATFLRLLYPLTPFSILESYFAPLLSRGAARLSIYISQR
jgi:hypothetical protein